MKKNKTKWILTVGLLFIYFEQIYFHIYKMNNLYNSDIASILVYGKTIHDTGNILPLEWHYSTEFGIILSSIISAILFQFVNNWKIIEIIVTSIIYFAIIIICNLISKKLDLYPENGILISMFSIAPISFYEIYYVSSGMYIIGIFYSLIYIYISLLLKEYEKKKYIINIMHKSIKKLDSVFNIKKVILNLTYILFCFYFGCCGFRYLMSLIAPLFIAKLIVLYIDNKENRIIEISDVDILYLCSPIIGFIGLIFNIIVIQRIWTFDSHSSRYLIEIAEIPNRLISSIGNIANYFGYQNSSLFSLSGIIALLGLLFFLIYFFCIFRLIKKYAELSVKQRYYLVFAISALLINTITILFTGESSTEDTKNKYYLITIYMAFPCISIYFNLWKEKSRKIITLLFSFIIFIISSYAITQNGNREDNLYTERMQIINLLRDKELYYGYASHWNASIDIFLSNGDLVIGNVYNFNTFENGKWLTSDLFFQQIEERDKYFVWLFQNEYDTYGTSSELLKNSDKIFENENFVIVEVNKE